MAVFCMLDEEGVINIPKPKHGWILDNASCFGFRYLCELVN